MTHDMEDTEALDSTMFTCVDVIIAIFAVAVCAMAAWCIA